MELKNVQLLLFDKLRWLINKLGLWRESCYNNEDKQMQLLLISMAWWRKHICIFKHHIVLPVLGMVDPQQPVMCWILGSLEEVQDRLSAASDVACLKIVLQVCENRFCGWPTLSTCSFETGFSNVLSAMLLQKTLQLVAFFCIFFLHVAYQWLEICCQFAASQLVRNPQFFLNLETHIFKT